MLALVDREGADIDVYRSLSQPDHDHETVQGETLHISKVPVGDWAELQHHTEEVWRRNARAVGEAVQSAAKEHAPRFVVVVAGEVRARAEVMGVLQSHGNLDAVEVEGGGRAPGSSQESLWRDVNIAAGAATDADLTALPVGNVGGGGAALLGWEGGSSA